MARLTPLRRRLLTGALLAGLAASGTPATAAPLRPQPCEQLAVSPGFTSDGTVFCAGTVLTGFTPTGLAVFVSTDKGRSWRQATAAGLPFKPNDRMTGLLVSPRYPTDRTVLVSVRGEGVFVSTDAAATFTPLLPLGTPTLTTFVGGVSAASAAQRTMVVAAQWLQGRPALIDPGTRSVQPVVGAPDPASDILVSPAWTTDHTAFAVTDTGTLGKNRVSLYACSIAFECTTRLATLPSGLRYFRGWLAADFAKSKTVFLHLLDETAGPPRLYVSRDGGTTFAPMAAAERLVAAHIYQRNRGEQPAIGIAVGPPGSDRVWMRIYGAARAAAASHALYRSDDNGRSWVRAAYGNIDGFRPRGTMPDLRLPPSPDQPPVVVAATADNRVFVNGIRTGGWGVGCGVNGGRTWGTFCR